MKITGRTSTITNAFVNSIIPVVYPTEDEVREALAILGMCEDSVACAYCGGLSSEWDHLRPLVIDKRPTGFISEIDNLVPACGKCNQSKGNKEWKGWIRSTAKLSPASKGVVDLEERISKLDAYESWGNPTIVDFESIIGADTWRRHWLNWESILDSMRVAQALATEINETIARHARTKPSTS